MEEGHERRNAMKKLTRRREKFCIEYIKNNGVAAEAYRKSFSTKNMKDETIWNNAYKLMQNNDVSAMIESLRAKAEAEDILSMNEVLVMLSGRAKEELNSDGLKAIDILNKMKGFYEKDNTQSNKVIVKGIDDFYEEQH